MRRLVVVLSLVMLAGSAIATEPVRKPNVIVILADDAGWGDLSCTGNRNLSTPAFDSLAQSGAMLKQFMVQPVCSPTRAEFLTGRYFPRTGVRGVSTGQERMASSERTIAQVFRDAGYRTGLFGKWHNGTQWPWHPQARGFDTFYGFTEGHCGAYFQPLLEHDGQFVRGQGYIADDLTTKAIDFIAQSHRAGKPFLCYVPFNTPHSPMSVPDDDWARWRDKPILQRGPRGDAEDLTFTRAALAMMENMDRNVGRLLKELDRLGATNNTIVVVFSDNGPNSPRWNGGLKAAKGSTDEGGVRSPCLVRYPARIPAGLEVPQLMGAIDLLPTLAELAEVPLGAVKPLDGKPLAALLLGNRAIPREVESRTIVACQAEKVSVRSQRYRLDAQGRLYEIATDPGQTRDVSAQNADEAARLKIVAQEYRRDVLETAPATAKEAFIVGYPGSPFTELPARDGLPVGGVKRSSVHPNASYFTNWKTLEDAITWKVDVAQAGRYEAELWYTCPLSDVGATVVLSLGTASSTTTITPGWDPPLNTNDDRHPRKEGFEKDFRVLKLGTLDLSTGPGVLTLNATTIPGASVADVRRLVLRPTRRE